MDRGSLCDADGEVHSGEEKYSSGPVELPRPGPSHGMVSSSQGIRYSLRSVQSSSYRLVCYKGKR